MHHSGISRTGRAELRENKNLLILQFTLWAAQHMVFEDLLRLHSSQSKICNHTHKKKKEASRKTGLPLPSSSYSPISGLLPPQSPQGTCGQREGWVSLIRLKEYLKELNQRTGLKTNQTPATESNLQNRCTNVLYQQQTSPWCNNTRNAAVLRKAVPGAAPPSPWPGQALVLPRHRYHAYLCYWATQRTPSSKQALAQLLQQLMLWTKFIKKNAERL